MIRDILNNLSEDDLAKLMFAFEQELSFYIELSNNTFIGVNIHEGRRFKIIERAGYWSYGTLN